MNDLLCLGELLVDFSPFDGGYRYNPGGAPSNVGAQFVKLGGKACLLSQVGDDLFGRKLIESVASFGIDTSFIETDSLHNTPLAFVDIRTNGNREFSFFRKNSSDLFYDEKKVKEAAFKGAKILHFGSVDLVDAPVKKAHEKAIHLARENGLIVSFDPNLRFGLWDSKEHLKETVCAFIPMADLIKMSEEELYFLSGLENEKKAVSSFMTGSVKMILITKGEKGASLFLKDGSFINSPGYRAKAIDTTGAGDSFDGAFLYELFSHSLSPKDLGSLRPNYQELLDFACKTASFSTEKFGAMSSYGNMDEIKSCKLPRRTDHEIGN